MTKKTNHNANKEELIMNDKELIKLAVLNYVEGWYEADGERMAQAIHEKLAKRRFLGNGEIWEVNRDWMVQATKDGNGKIDRPETGKKEITILDMTPTMASVKLVSEKYDDYLHLAKENGRWVIVNALWDFLPGVQ
jgi:hypothetical protein